MHAFVPMVSAGIDGPLALYAPVGMGLFALGLGVFVAALAAYLGSAGFTILVFAALLLGPGIVALHYLPEAPVEYFSIDCYLMQPLTVSGFNPVALLGCVVIAAASGYLYVRRIRTIRF